MIHHGPTQKEIGGQVSPRGLRTLPMNNMTQPHKARRPEVWRVPPQILPCDSSTFLPTRFRAFENSAIERLCQLSTELRPCCSRNSSESL